MAAYENRYTLITAPNKKVEDLTLYAACKALEAIAAENKLLDITHIRRSGRVVAFFSEWHKATTAMWQATDEEKEVITMWRP